MGKKYIIEIPEDKIEDFVGSTHFLMPYMMAGHIGHHDTELPIEPYAEPDLEYVRKEAYKEGREAGIKDGMCEAWEVARKIIHMPEGDLLELFDAYSSVCTPVQVMLKYDATEAIAKIKEYEDGKQKINVGDEVENTQTGVKFIVTHQWKNNRGEQGVSGLNYECSAFSTTLDLVRKTGRHFPEIAAVLEKMRGEQE